MFAESTRARTPAASAPYSKQPVDWFEMGESWSPRLEISAGGLRQMEALGQSGEYYALLITANELKWRHEAMIELGASWEWPEYQPHISIQIRGDIDLSKVEPYQGKIVLGPEIFEEVREAETELTGREQRTSGAVTVHR
ncbi:hypothetical protein [Rhizobium leguminosarum]|uniref:hypothetical protein n=1 Tax=Rhizobium leguminosarum TaxID=384 RepID=UPI0021BBD14E|nr:hypothetical protein [Rhizobium leguminosarum]